MPLVTSAWQCLCLLCVAPVTLSIFVNLVLRHLYIWLLQVNFSLKRIMCRVTLVGMANFGGLQGSQADYQMKAQWCTKACSYLLQTLWAVPQWVSVLSSSWFLSHFPRGSTSSPIRVAAEQEMADMRVLREEGFFLFILMIYPLMSPRSWRVLSCDPCYHSRHLLKMPSFQGQDWASTFLEPHIQNFILFGISCFLKCCPWIRPFSRSLLLR